MLEGKPPKLIGIHGTHFKKKDFAYTGDLITVTILGSKMRGVIVGCKQDQKSFRPKFDSNNLVLVNNEGSPIGTRIHVPVPINLRSKLRSAQRPKGADYTKLLSIC